MHMSGVELIANDAQRRMSDRFAVFVGCSRESVEGIKLVCFTW